MKLIPETHHAQERYQYRYCKDENKEQCKYKGTLTNKNKLYDVAFI